MKTSTFLAASLLVVLTAGCSDKSKPEETPPARPPTLSERVQATTEKAKESAIDAKHQLENKLAEWNLDATDVKSELEKSGRVVRERTLAAGERAGGALDNARIVAAVNSKYVADSDLSALKIDVNADKGVVTLNGAVGSVELIGRAVALALDTEGVSRVIGQLTVEGGAATSSANTM
jgi:osmotically-inducible protein OsmY